MYEENPPISPRCQHEPPCDERWRDLLANPVNALLCKNKDRLPECLSVDYMRESVRIWAEKNCNDAAFLLGWSDDYPLSVGQQALKARSDREPKTWADYQFEVKLMSNPGSERPEMRTPFAGNEEALLILNLEFEGGTLELFGLGKRDWHSEADGIKERKGTMLVRPMIDRVNYETGEVRRSRPMSTEIPPKGKERKAEYESVERPETRFPGSGARIGPISLEFEEPASPELIAVDRLALVCQGSKFNLLDAAKAMDKWWGQYRGLTFRGRPRGTGTWASSIDYERELRRVVSEIRAENAKITQERVAEKLHTSERQIGRWCKDHGLAWEEVLNF